MIKKVMKKRKAPTPPSVLHNHGALVARLRPYQQSIENQAKFLAAQRSMNNRIQLERL